MLAPLTHSLPVYGKELFVRERNASVSYSFNPLCHPLHSPPNYVGRFVHVFLLLYLVEDIPEYADESGQNPSDVNQVSESGKVDEGRGHCDLAAKTLLATASLSRGV